MPAAVRPVFSQELRRVIAEQRLGSVATVCPDSTPNLSPKGDGLPDAVGRIRSIVLIKVERASPLLSPAYDLGQSEQEVRARWMSHFQQLWEAAATVARSQG